MTVGSVGLGGHDWGVVVRRFGLEFRGAELRKLPEELQQLGTVPERRPATCSHVPGDAPSIAGGRGMVGGGPEADHEGIHVPQCPDGGSSALKARFRPREPSTRGLAGCLGARRLPGSSPAPRNPPRLPGTSPGARCTSLWARHGSGCSPGEPFVPPPTSNGAILLARSSNSTRDAPLRSLCEKDHRRIRPTRSPGRRAHAGAEGRPAARRPTRRAAVGRQRAHQEPAAGPRPDDRSGTRRSDDYGW